VEVRTEDEKVVVEPEADPEVVLTPEEFATLNEYLGY
jgi:hypothetical protein